MKTVSIGFLCLLLVFCGYPLSVSSQQGVRIFMLPDAQAGEPYGTDLEAVLRDQYRLRLQGSSENTILRWALADGDLPTGMDITTEGRIVGTPQGFKSKSYHFRLEVVDSTFPNEKLTLDCSLSVKSAGLRLVKINGPTLAPLKADVAYAGQVDGNSTDSMSSRSTPQEGGPAIRWVEPNVQSGTTVENVTQSPNPLAIKIESSANACLLDILVMKKDDDGPANQLVDHQTKKVDYNQDSQRFQVNLARGYNHVIVTAYRKAKKDDKCELDTNVSSLLVAAPILRLTAECDGENCGKISKPEESKDLSSRNMRAILGIEQSGASSAASAQNPFVDFFFNAQLSKNRWLTWGDIRLTTTPQQVAAFASSATNAVGAATADKINDLATSFDFKIGPEFQLNPKSNTRLSLIAGFGAISTLTGPPKGSPIFKVPANTSAQYANFVNQYPEALTPGATHIAFVPQEQDRFYRQYFAGLRVRSYHKEQFPSMFDVTFGQNSAVTGGMLRHFVLGFEGSHHIPLMNNAIYIFGSANLKVGGPKFRSTPFVLDPAEATVKLSDPTVVITSRQSNRDVYRIGFGIDLIGLFNKKKE